MASKPRILIIEDDEKLALALKSAFDGFEVTLRNREPLSPAEEQEPLVTLIGLDSSVNGRSDEGLRILQTWRQAGHRETVIAYTGNLDRTVAVQAVRYGATEVFCKPLDLAFLKGLVIQVGRMADLEREARKVLLTECPEAVPGLLGTSASMQRIFDAIRKVSTNDVPILITGERGTGKELTAKAIHEQSDCRMAPFITMNCGGIPERLLESELFGYEHEAQAEAVNSKPGKVEFAQGGTIFLDEVDELPQSLQGKLARFLQDGTFQRVGGLQRREGHVRIIAATHVNLQEATERGAFRADLYDRLKAVHINMPPLREREEDIALLAMAFLRHAAAHHEKDVHGFTREALDAMRTYTWPGNVRELSNRVNRAVVMAVSNHVRPEDLDISEQMVRQDEGSISLKVNQQRIETDLIMKAFTLSQGNLSRAAHELGISRSTLYRRLRQYGMDRTMDARRPLGGSRAWMSNH